MKKILICLLFLLATPLFALEWNEVDQKWDDAFDSLDQLELNLQDLEFNLSVAEGLVHTLTNDLNDLNTQWDMLVIRMQENDEDYHQMYVDYEMIYEENEALKEASRRKTWWIVGGCAIGIGVGALATGIVIGILK